MSERPDRSDDGSARQGGEEWLRAMLADAVPEAPVEPGRAGAARRLAARRRRRTTAVVGVAAALVVAVPALGIATLGGGGDDPVATPGPSQSGVAVDCPPLPEDGAGDTGPGTLPEGAVAVRLCTGQGHGFQEPGELLTTGVDELVDLVNAQPVTGPSEVCTMDLGIGYRLAVGYPGGEVRVVAGELYGCRALTVGDTVRADPEKVWNRTIGLLRAQRAATEPPADVAAPPLACEPAEGSPDGIETSPVARPGEMTSAIACVRYESASTRPVRAVEVPAGDLRVLMADLAERDARQHRYEPCGPDVPSVALVGATAWGDRTALWSSCGVFETPGGGWAPSPRAQAIIDRLVAEAGAVLPSVDASSTASQVVAAYVDLVNAGDREAAAALWVGDAQLPPEGLRIGFKGGNERPLRSVSSWRDAVSVEAVYWEYDEEGASGDDDEVRFLVVRDSDDAPYRIQSREPLT